MMKNHLRKSRPFLEENDGDGFAWDGDGERENDES